MRFFRTVVSAERNPFRCSYTPWKVFEEGIFIYAFTPERYRYGRTADDEKETFYLFIASKDAQRDSADMERFACEALSDWGAVNCQIVQIAEWAYTECVSANGFEWERAALNAFRRALGADELYEFMHGSNYFWDENLGERLSQEVVLEKAAHTVYAKSLNEEMERIFSGQTDEIAGDGWTYEGWLEDQTSALFAPVVEAPRTPSIVPVHYLIEGDHAKDYDPALHALLVGLHAAGRLTTDHVYHFDIDGFKNDARRRPPIGDEDVALAMANDNLIECMAPCTLVLKYGLYDKDGSYDQFSYQMLTRFLEAVDKARNRIQLVLITPRGCADLEHRIAQHFSAPLMALRQDAPIDMRQTDEEALLRTLVERAEEQRIEPDAQLGKLLHERLQDHSLDSLDDVYHDWLQVKLIAERFPQYESFIERTKSPNRPVLSALDELHSLIGLAEVKRSIEEVMLQAKANARLAHEGLPTRDFSYHLAFVGAPGTGKTEVARLYGRILKEEGILQEGRVISLSGSELYNVKDTFEAARGSVLFIDEAYSIAPWLVSTLIAYMENLREEVVVILAGYEAAMNQLFAMNEGFRSRIGNIIAFPEYRVEEKMDIFRLMCRRKGLILPESTESAVLDVLSRGGRRADEGNGRFVRNLFHRVWGAQQVRLAKGSLVDYTHKELLTLLPADVESQGLSVQSSAKRARTELEELIGLESVKNMVEQRIDYQRILKAKRDAGIKAPIIPMHMVFKGNPGTGKTEVARLIGRIMKEEGLLSVGGFYELSQKDLVSPFVGMTAIQIGEIFQEARGSVIFIDEAYSLCDQSKGTAGAASSASAEAITAIIDNMEKLRDEVVVIFAGYSDEMDKLIASNPGFSSRVRCELEFPDYCPDELFAIFKHMAKANGLRLGRGVKRKVENAIAKAVKVPGFGNARYVRNLIQDAMLEQGTRLAKTSRTEGRPVEAFSKQELVTLLPSDIQEHALELFTPSHPIGFCA